MSQDCIWTAAPLSLLWTLLAIALSNSLHSITTRIHVYESQCTFMAGCAQLCSKWPAVQYMAQLCSKWPAAQYRANCVANGQLCSIWPTV